MKDYYIFKKEWARWIYSAGSWNIGGTLNFALNSKPSLAEAERKWQLFWNKIDRACYGQSSTPVRLPRIVFTHHGSSGDNHHIHFLSVAHGDQRDFCILLNAIWTGLEGAGSAVAEQNEILPLFSKRHAAWYLTHEDRAGDMSGFNEKLTALEQPKAKLRDNALIKLRSAADRFDHLSKATAAFDQQLDRAEQRYIRRNAY
jgi:hypothetical protein